jgi:peroxiredoxin Q/BCP
MSIPNIGETAPDFVLLTQQEERIRLSDLRGKRIVLYFYPAADTPT